MQPCGLPPFGTLNAFDPATGAKKWSVPFGSMFGLPESLGSINLGGPLTTAGGLTFIGASLDPAIRAFSTQSGKELWRGTLPHGARSLPRFPASYASGRAGEKLVCNAFKLLVDGIRSRSCHSRAFRGVLPRRLPRLLQSDAPFTENLRVSQISGGPWHCLIIRLVRGICG